MCRLMTALLLTACFDLVAAPVAANPVAYVSLAGSNALLVLDTATGAATTVSLAFLPGGVAGTPDGRRVFVAHEGDGKISVLDTTTLTVIATIPVAPSSQLGGKLAVTRDGTRLYVPVSDAGTVAVIDTVTNAVVGTWASGGGTIGVAVSPDGSRLYASNVSAQTVSVFDTASGARVTDIPVSNGPDRLAINPAGTRLYVPVAYSSGLAVIDTSTNQEIARVPIPGYPLWAVVSPDGRKVFVSTQISSLAIIDATTNTLSAVLPVGALAGGLAVTPDGSRVYVAADVDNQLTIVDGVTDHIIAVRPTTEGLGTLDVFIGPDCLDGGACSDGNPCTIGDVCRDTVCAGDPVQCIPTDQCHDAGICNTATGACSTPPKAAGTVCDDHNLWTSDDMCDGSGACAGQCVAPDTDADGEVNPTDRCPATPPGEPVDDSGCSQAQFCATFDATTRDGARACKRADWQNDEPLMKGKQRDCTVDRATLGTADDRCVPLPNP